MATFGLLFGSVLLVAVAQPIQTYMQATAAQLFELQPYLQIIRGGEA
jgi:multicomponent K+:H+ antiporter subunit D